jgi:hypothetical protein
MTAPWLTQVMCDFRHNVGWSIEESRFNGMSPLFFSGISAGWRCGRKDIFQPAVRCGVVIPP